MITILLILLCAAYFGWLGAMAMFLPGRLLSGYGIKVSGPDGFNEIRAVYGGLPLMWSGLLLLSLWRPQLHTDVALSVAAAAFAMAAGRVISACIDGKLGRFPAIFLAAELAVLAALVGSVLVQPA